MAFEQKSMVGLDKYPGGDILGILKSIMEQYLDQQRQSKLAESQTQIPSGDEVKKSQTVTSQQSKGPTHHLMPAAKSVIEIAKNSPHRIFGGEQSKQ